MGDYVVVLHAEKLKLSGRKREQKTYSYYTGWRGGLKERKLTDVMEREPGRVIREAVRRMLPKTKLGRSMLSKLKVYPGSEHPHAAQTPSPLDLATLL